MVLYRLLERRDPDRIQPVGVISLTGDGPLGDPIRELGVPVVLLDIRRPAALPATLRRLRREIRAARPDVVQTWMYHGDLVGGLAARSAGVRPVVWGLHASTRPADGPRTAARIGVGISARLSHRLPTRIVACADAARDVHVGLGYDASRIVVIPNGFDLVPPPTAEHRAALRESLGVPTGRQVVLRLARYHPQKDYPTFLAAAGAVVAAGADVHLVLAGLDVTTANADLTELLRRHGLESRTTLLGLHARPQDLLAVADVAVSSSSYGEAFPLVIGEAMANGVPVVTTDVGDSARLVGPDAGVVVAPADPAALADAVLSLLRASASERAAMAEAGRRRVADEFSLATMVGRYEALYEQLATTGAGRA